MRTRPEAEEALRQWADEALLRRMEEARTHGQVERVPHLQYLRLANALRGFRLRKVQRT